MASRLLDRSYRRLAFGLCLVLLLAAACIEPLALRLAALLAVLLAAAWAWRSLDRGTEELVQRVRAAERVRQDFVANVSHELRTPLASIRGFAETLRGGAVDDAEVRMEFIETIEKDAQRLTAIVDDLLDLSAIESGSRPLELEELDLLEAARETAASLKPQAERGKVLLFVRHSPELPNVRADRSQLKQVFTNLLANAVKFNREGGSVTVTAQAQDGFVEVRVRDTGFGIPEPDLKRIFERFYRVDKARSRELGGTGLGLSIVKHIVEAHGGTVGVESVEGEGSTFRFTLPAV